MSQPDDIDKFATELALYIRAKQLDPQAPDRRELVKQFLQEHPEWLLLYRRDYRVY